MSGGKLKHSKTFEAFTLIGAYFLFLSFCGGYLSSLWGENESLLTFIIVVTVSLIGHCARVKEPNIRLQLLALLFFSTVLFLILSWEQLGGSSLNLSDDAILFFVVLSITSQLLILFLASRKASAPLFRFVMQAPLGEMVPRNALFISARRMRTLAWVSLGGVFSTIILAVVVTLFAGVITNIDLTGSVDEISLTNELSRLRESKVEYSTEIQKSEAQIQALDSLRGRSIQIADEDAFTDFRNIVESMDSSVSAENLFSASLAAQTKLRQASINLEDTERDIERVLKRIGELSSEPSSNGEDGNVLIASAITRFGVIAVLMFFAQALLNLYRYSLVMSGAYTTRALALGLGDESKPNTIKEIHDVLTTDHISMGRAPNAPLDEATKIAEMASKLSK